MIPRRLHALSEDAFAGFVSDLIERLSEISQSTSSINDFFSQCLEPSCKYLKTAMHKLPFTLANEISTHLLSSVLNTYCKFDKKLLEPFPGYKTDCTLCEEIVLKISHATCHPQVTEIKIAKRFPFPAYFSPYEYKFLTSYFENVLPNSVHLKVLKIDATEFKKESLAGAMCLLVSLEVFICHRCNDAILEALTKSCHLLKHLDVSGSRAVTDESLLNISRLQHLEHLHIYRTGISDNGVKNLIHELSHQSRKSSITTFASFLSPPHINLISKSFFYIRSLELHLTSSYNLEPLKYLKYLVCLCLNNKYGYAEEHHRDFHICSFLFSDAKQLLEEIGTQLLELDLIEVSGTDLKFIAEKCTSLVRLGLSFKHREMIGITENLSYEECFEKHPIPEFRSVAECYVSISNSTVMEYILSKCVNLKKVRLKDICYVHSLWRGLLRRMIHGTLQELDIQGNVIKASGQWIIISRIDGKTLVKHREEMSDTSDDELKEQLTKMILR